MTLVVVGSVAFDSIETPDGRVDEALGGSAVHFSLASCALTATKLVGVVGEDFPESHRELLSGRGIDLAGLETVDGGKTFRWEGKYFENLNRRETLSVDLNVFEDFKPALPAPYRSAECVFLANGAPVTQASVLEQVDGKPFVMADTMDLWIQIAHEDLVSLIDKIDGLVLNDEEAELLSGESNLLKAGHKIRGYGLRYVIVKKGEHGCLIFHEDGVTALPAYPLSNVVDPTGAGDSFAGGIMGYLTNAGSTELAEFKRAVAWGTVMASFCCESFGVDRVAKLSNEEASARYKEYCAMLAL